MRVDTGRLRVVSPEASGAGLSATDGPPSPGRYIREQRERQGMTVEQLAMATKIPRRQLELIESDRYDQLAGPVFVKGFLRCCARALRLDEQAVIGLLYEQERGRLRARRRETTGSVSGPVAPLVAAERSGRWPRLVARIADPRVVLWLIVGLLVALIVIVAFTLADAAGGGPPQS